MYKLDVDKKDKLINELSNYREVERVQVCNHNHDSYVDKSTIEQTKREMFSLSAKYEAVQNEVNQMSSSKSSANIINRFSSIIFLAHRIQSQSASERGKKR